jgi:thioredoxin reductase (NADPH)
MAENSPTDVLIVGAGPAGLFAAFQLGIHGISATIVDSGKQPGGQCVALYADKPVYDMPGFAKVDAGEIALRLADQATHLGVSIVSGTTVLSITRDDTGFVTEAGSGSQFLSTFIVLATGLGDLAAMAAKASIALPEGVEYSGARCAVDTSTFETGAKGVHAIGDAANYPGKLPLLVSAFHEAALTAFAIKQRLAGDLRSARLEYTSTSSTLKPLFKGR